MTSVVECYQLAKNKSYPVFGIQGASHLDRECWSSSDALQNYGKHGAAGSKCCTKGMGRAWANDVYMILGTFRRSSGEVVVVVVVGGGGGGGGMEGFRRLGFFTNKICPCVFYNSLGKVKYLYFVSIKGDQSLLHALLA